MSDPTGSDISTAEPHVASGPRAATDVESLAARFLVLAADDFSGYSPVYERIARAIADDAPTLALLLDAAPVGRTPVLALAAVHDLVLSEPDSPLAAIYAGRSDDDPWPVFRALVHSRSTEVLGRMRTRSIQTNEVGRSAALVPALAAVRARAVSNGDDRPLALVEIGPSAGLNLLFDRYGITYRRHGLVVATAGDPCSPVQLACELRGPGDPVLDGPPVPIADRTGLDLDPVDVTDDDACRWLSACLWPGVPDRPERLSAAIGLARREPPALVAGDALTDLVPLIGRLRDDVLPVVVSTWAMAYLGRAGRTALIDGLDTLAAGRDLALVSAEEPRVSPWLPSVPAPVLACADTEGDGTTTLLGMRMWQGGTATDESLALCHPHVRWMAWIPGAGSDR